MNLKNLLPQENLFESMTRNVSLPPSELKKKLNDVRKSTIDGLFQNTDVILSARNILDKFNEDYLVLFKHQIVIEKYGNKDLKYYILGDDDKGMLNIIRNNITSNQSTVGTLDDTLRALTGFRTSDVVGKTNLKSPTEINEIINQSESKTNSATRIDENAPPESNTKLATGSIITHQVEGEEAETEGEEAETEEEEAETEEEKVRRAEKKVTQAQEKATILKKEAISATEQANDILSNIIKTHNKTFSLESLPKEEIKKIMHLAPDDVKKNLNKASKEANQKEKAAKQAQDDLETAKAELETAKAELEAAKAVTETLNIGSTEDAVPVDQTRSAVPVDQTRSAVPGTEEKKVTVTTETETEEEKVPETPPVTEETKEDAVPVDQTRSAVSGTTDTAQDTAQDTRIVDDKTTFGGKNKSFGKKNYRKKKYTLKKPHAKK